MADNLSDRLDNPSCLRAPPYLLAEENVRSGSPLGGMPT